MKVEAFWNRAFLAALQRLPAKRAKAEADAATELALEHWHSKAGDQVRIYQKLSRMPMQLAALVPKGESMQTSKRKTSRA